MRQYQVFSAVRVTVLRTFESLCSEYLVKSLHPKSKTIKRARRQMRKCPRPLTTVLNSIRLPDILEHM